MRRDAFCYNRRLKGIGPKGDHMQQGLDALAQTGDSFLPFIVGGVVVVALIVAVIAFVLMRRR